MQIEQLKPIIEAALLAASQPLTVAQLDEFIRKSAGARHRAEIAERAARVLKDAMEDAK